MITTVPTSGWTAVVTTEGDTVFENKGTYSVYLTSDATDGVGPTEGLTLLPGYQVVFGSGMNVSASSPYSAGRLFYTRLT